MIGYLIGMYVAKGDHMGFPASNLTPVNMVNFLKASRAPIVGPGDAGYELQYAISGNGSNSVDACI